MNRLLLETEGQLAVGLGGSIKDSLWQIAYGGSVTLADV